MDPLDLLNRMPPRLARVLEKPLKSLPGIRRMIEKEYDEMMDDLVETVKPYQDGFDTFTQIPAEGCDRASILDEMQRLRDLEEGRWKDGRVSGAVYHGDQDHIDFLNQVYALQSQSNPLHSDVWPSASKFEAEIVAMTAHMLGRIARARDRRTKSWAQSRRAGPKASCWR